MKRYARGLVFCLIGLLAFGCRSARPGGTTAPAKAGSMARFVMHLDHLYALDGWDLRVYATTALGLPYEVYKTRIPADAETLFPVGELLYVGAQNGMLVYSLEEPSRPELLGTAAHVVSCDPVVVEDDFAYVTLRSGSGCRRGVDALLVFDVHDPTQPMEIARRGLPNPRGLGVEDGVLFVADAKGGLLVFDVRNPFDPWLIQEVPGIAGYDVIPDEGILIVSADDGLYQYLYDAMGLLPRGPISRIPVGPTPQVATEPAAARRRR